MIESSHYEEIVECVVDGMGQRAFRQRGVYEQAKGGEARLLISPLELTPLQPSYMHMYIKP